MRWMVTGAGGMTGSDVVELLEASGEPVVAASKEELDITSADVHEFVRQARPDVILNCAAYTKVDDCEANPGLADRVNGEAVRILADAANREGALLVQISTDFVFDGTARIPYPVDAPVAPVSAYGRSKLLGEKNAAMAKQHLIVRTSWLFGHRGPSFPAAILRQIDAGKSALRVVDDQSGRPTWTPHLAEALVALARLAREDESARGIVHYADAPACTWFDLAKEIVGIAKPGVVVEPVSTAEFPRPARRPKYSVLSTEKYEALTGRRPAQWIDGLREFLAAARQPPS
ncbi:MAG: dTDP-4-dehydrorhamnose reductase [Thermoanaerobaculia bacterium]